VFNNLMFCSSLCHQNRNPHRSMFVSSGSNEDIYRCVADACSFLIYHRVRYLICLLK
jgi:hypothetical protein